MSDDLEKLRQNNKELRQIVNNSWDGIAIIGKDSKFIYTNSACSPILGFAPDELKQKHFSSLLLDTYIEAFEKLLKKVKEDIYSNNLQVVCKRKDGQNVYLHLTVSPMINDDFLVLNLKDITKQISDDEILNNYVISLHTNIDGTIQKASQAFCHISGYAQEELKDQNFAMNLHEDMPKKIFEEMVTTLNNGEQWRGDLKFIKKDKNDYWVNMTTKPVYNKYGDITGYTALMFDITTEINLVKQKQTLQKEVGRAKEDIRMKDAKLEVMGETLQMISHEWRQPLNIISIQSQKLGLSYMMGDNPPADEASEILDEIKGKADELSSIIEDFQSFVEIKESKKPSNITDIIEKVLFEFEENNIEIVSNLRKIKDFDTYPSELKKIILNLLNNSKEAIERENIPNGKITIQTYNEDSTRATIKIIDNGGGIKSDMDKIFNPYFSTKEKQHGVGLGLYMCKLIIELHLSGQIEATNGEDGAIFKITIPLK